MLDYVMFIGFQGDRQPHQVIGGELGKPIHHLCGSGTPPFLCFVHRDDFSRIHQFVTLYRALLDNPAVVNADEKLQSAFGNSLLLLAGFIVRFDHDFTPVRLRIKFCSLVELAAKRCDPSGVLRRETFERHELLEMVVDWVRDPPAVWSPCLRFVSSLLTKTTGS
jgi:hypothetical protein